MLKMLQIINIQKTIIKIEKIKCKGINVILSVQGPKSLKRSEIRPSLHHKTFLDKNHIIQQAHGRFFNFVLNLTFIFTS